MQHACAKSSLFLIKSQLNPSLLQLLKSEWKIESESELLYISIFLPVVVCGKVLKLIPEECAGVNVSHSQLSVHPVIFSGGRPSSQLPEQTLTPSFDSSRKFPLRIYKSWTVCLASFHTTDTTERRHPANLCQVRIRTQLPLFSGKNADVEGAALSSWFKVSARHFPLFSTSLYSAALSLQLIWGKHIQTCWESLKASCGFF